MAIPVSFDGVEPMAGGGIVPPGDYLVRVDAADETESSRGTPGIEMQLRIVGGPEDGRLLFDTLWITAKAMGMVRHRLECMGVAIPAGKWQLSPQTVTGRRARVVVRHEQYTSREGEQKTRAKVAAWEPVGSDWPPASPFEDAPSAAPAAAGGGRIDPDGDIPFGISAV